MTLYMWSNEIFMYKLKLSTIKAINEDNDKDRYERILEKLNHLEMTVKSMGVNPYSEGQLK
ncbi:hypothetical protein J1N35_043829 [Gossypium stocksii]|uniref:Uncharacterized protein n=1 Tax=Gossypium stocksii TaxID=47602 RepID=A0A9D3ZFF8_9ROSI|nr:hypothetical protein J1N35_043829 [Gossypium stocksii]